MAISVSLAPLLQMSSLAASKRLARMRPLGVDLDDPTTWTKPVVRIPCPEEPSFAAAGTSPALWQMYDVLLGPGRWIPRQGVGGTIPVRFPSDSDPGDAGWHIDGSYDVEGRWFVNVRSRHRGLLALFLFTDASADDAPTELIVGARSLPGPRAMSSSVIPSWCIARLGPIGVNGRASSPSRRSRIGSHSR